MSRRHDPERTRTWNWILASAALAAGCTATTTESRDAVERRAPAERIKSIIERHTSSIDEYRLFRAPLEPIPGSRVLPEYVDHEALAVAITYEVAINPELLESVLEIVEGGLRVTDVVVLIDDTWMETAMIVVQGLESRGLWPASEQQAVHELEIIDVPLDSIWIRDYGPLFSEVDGTVILSDCIYREVRGSADGSDTTLALLGALGSGVDPTTALLATMMAGEEGSGGHSRARDDAAPMYLASHLSVAQKQVDAVRPPLVLWGGDFAADSLGNVFVSTETVRMNGGAIDEFEFLMREYFGAERVVYLEPLPGNTIKHIDMFFRVVDDSTFLLAEYAPSDDEHPYLEYLDRRAEVVLERNFEKLRLLFPDRDIVRIPMPGAELVSASSEGLGDFMYGEYGYGYGYGDLGSYLLEGGFDPPPSNDEVAQRRLETLFAGYGCAEVVPTLPGTPLDLLHVALLDLLDDDRWGEVGEEILGLPTVDDCQFLTEGIARVLADPKAAETELLGTALLFDWIESQPTAAAPSDAVIDRFRTLSGNGGRHPREASVWAATELWGLAIGARVDDAWDEYENWSVEDGSEDWAFDTGTTDPDSYNLVYRPFCNYCVLEGDGESAVLVPQFEGFEEQSERALRILSQLYPQHQLIPIEATTLAMAYGGIHCVTLQIPEMQSSGIE